MHENCCVAASRGFHDPPTNSCVQTVESISSHVVPDRQETTFCTARTRCLLYLFGISDLDSRAGGGLKVLSKRCGADPGPTIPVLRSWSEVAEADGGSEQQQHGVSPPAKATSETSLERRLLYRTARDDVSAPLSMRPRRGAVGALLYG